jgi:hypothetical protein
MFSVHDDDVITEKETGLDSQRKPFDFLQGDCPYKVDCVFPTFSLNHTIAYENPRSGVTEYSDENGSDTSL